MIRMMVILAGAVLVAGVGASPIETVVLGPSEVVDIEAGTEEMADPHVAVKFDLTGLPEEAVVFYAALRLTEGTGSPWEVEYVPVVVAPAAHTWDAEAEGVAWDEGRTARRVLMRQAATPSKFVVTKTVKEWVGGIRPNNGLVAMLEEVADLQDMATQFNAEALKPSLEIRYFLPQGTRK
jgi:hypothetical protein